MSLKDDVTEEFLKSISLKGSIDGNDINVIIANRSQCEKLLNLSSGLPRIQMRLQQRFKMILSQPETLKVLNPFQIRCCLCGKIISYPAWYWQEKLAVNWFHYFVCFNRLKSQAVTAACYRRV